MARSRSTARGAGSEGERAAGVARAGCPRRRPEGGPEAADLRRAAAHRYPRSRDGVAIGAGARSRRVRGDRIRARRRSASMACCRLRCRSARRRSACGWRLAPSRATFCRWSCAAAWLAVAGVVPGIALAYAAGRSMEALLAGVKPADTLTLAARSAVGADDVRRQRDADTARAARRSDHRSSRGVTFRRAKALRHTMRRRFDRTCRRASALRSLSRQP